jgi:hypothetical protein
MRSGHGSVDHPSLHCDDGEMEEYGCTTAECADNQSQGKNTMTFGRHQAKERAQQRQVPGACELC